MQEGGFHYNWYKMLKPDQRKDLEEEAMEVWTEDALQYHDLNKDFDMLYRRSSCMFAGACIFCVCFCVIRHRPHLFRGLRGGGITLCHDSHGL